jgi:hypothetical protein
MKSFELNSIKPFSNCFTVLRGWNFYLLLPFPSIWTLLLPVCLSLKNLKWTQFWAASYITSRYSSMYCSMFLPGMPTCPCYQFLRGLPTKMFYAFLISTMHSTCPKHFNCLNLIIQVFTFSIKFVLIFSSHKLVDQPSGYFAVLDEVYKLWRSL